MSKTGGLCPRYVARASPEGDVTVDKNVSRALSRKFGSSDRVHVGSAAETIGEEQGVSISSRLDQERPKESTLTAMTGPSGRNIEMTGYRTASREVSRAWHFRQWQSHQQMLIQIHQ